MSNKADASSVSILAIVAGLLCIFFNVQNPDRYFLNEPLNSRVIIIDDRPKFIDGGRRGTDRYTFAGREHLCRFWLSEGALTAAKRNDSVEHAIKAINIGDTITIQVRTSEIASLEDSTKRIRVMGLTYHNDVLIDPQYVYSEDQGSRKLNLGAGIVFLLIGIIVQIWRYRKKRAQPEEETQAPAL